MNNPMTLGKLLFSLAFSAFFTVIFHWYMGTVPNVWGIASWFWFSVLGAFAGHYLRNIQLARRGKWNRR